MDAETEFYVRIFLLVFKGGTLVCKRIVDREIEHVGLDTILQSQEPSLKQKLLRYQYVTLFPKSGTPNYQEFDLSLLTVVLLEVITIPRDERQEVENIKKVRNEIVHNGKVFLDKGTYSHQKCILSEALKHLSAKFDTDLQNECKELIQHCLNEPLDEKAAFHYIRQIRNDEEALQRVYEKLEQRLTQITKTFEDHDQRVTTKLEELKKGQDMQGQMIRELNEGQDKIGQMMKELRSKASGFNNDNDETSPKEEGFRKDQPLCEQCIEKSTSTKAIYFCCSCSKFYCYECKDLMHDKSLLLVMKNHHIQNAKDCDTSKLDIENINVCKEHSKGFRYYCKQHGVICCDKCVGENHQTCKEVVEIDKVAKSSTNCMLDPVAEIERMHESTRSMDYWMTSFEEKFNKSIENTPALLLKKRQEMLDLFDKKTTMVLNRAEKYKEETLQIIQKKRSQCKDLMHYTEHTKRSLIRIASTGTPAQRFIARQNVSSQIRTVEDDFSRIRQLDNTPSDFADLQIFDEMARELGPLSLNIPNADNNY